MIRRAALLTALVAAIALVLGSGAAPGHPKGPSCHASTALGSRPHELEFRVRCNFEVEDVSAQPSEPAEIRAVRRHPRVRNGDSDDRFRCRRSDDAALCTGTQGRGATLVGALRMHGDRCRTATDFGIQGGIDCDGAPPGTGCPAIGYVAKVRDPRPSGCD